MTACSSNFLLQVDDQSDGKLYGNPVLWTKRNWFSLMWWVPFNRVNKKPIHKHPLEYLICKRMEGTGDKSRNNTGVSVSDNFSNLNDTAKDQRLSGQRFPDQQISSFSCTTKISIFRQILSIFRTQMSLAWLQKQQWWKADFDSNTQCFISHKNYNYGMYFFIHYAANRKSCFVFFFNNSKL